MTTFTGEVHQYAGRWPMASDEELSELAASITANGQRFPITLDSAGRLIDGRNRLAACELAGVAPLMVVDESLTSEDAIVAYVWDVNGQRRDMTKGQKAMMAALAPGTQRALSAHTGVAEGYLNKARQVIQWCDEVTIKAVIDGDMPLNDAYAQAQQIKAMEQAEEIARRKAEAEAKRQAEEAARKLAELREHAPDLAGHVDGGQPITEAWAAYRERTRKAREAAEAAERNRRDAAQAIAQAVHTLAHRGQHGYAAEAITSYRHDDVPNSLRITRRAIDDALVALAEFRKDARIA